MSKLAERSLTCISQALTESSHTLDFISLLLTAYNPKQASFTISPFIKQTLPEGCLTAEIVDPLKVSEITARQNELASFGWKLQSMTTAADSLLRAASDLEKEMGKEAKYWEQMLSVKNKGWPVFRLPQDRHALGVRLGSLESPAEFRDKGVAALRRGEDGAVELDMGRYAAKQTLRVRVKAQGKLVASNHICISADRSLEATLLQARNDLFDEELFNEMHREARSLTNRGVKCVSEGISIPLKKDVAILVDLVNSDESQLDMGHLDDGELALYPEMAATALRILLSYSHRLHYRRRTEQPPPLKQRKRARPLPSILQPIMLHLEHRSAIMAAHSCLLSIEQIMHTAGIAFDIGQVEGSLDLKRFLDPKHEIDSSHFIDELMRALCRTPQSTITVQAGINSTVFEVSARTDFNGTEFLVNYSTEAMDSILSATPHEMLFDDITALKEHMCHVVMLELIHAVSSTHPKWEASSPDEGQLTTEPTLQGEMEMLTIKLDTESLQLKWDTSNDVAVNARQVVWRGSETGAAKPNSFLEEVELLSNLQ